MSELKTYSLKEVCEITNISLYGIRKAIEEGQLKAVRLGSGTKSSFRVSEKNLEKFINGEV